MVVVVHSSVCQRVRCDLIGDHPKRASIQAHQAKLQSSPLVGALAPDFDALPPQNRFALPDRPRRKKEPCPLSRRRHLRSGIAWKDSKDEKEQLVGVSVCGCVVSGSFIAPRPIVPCARRPRRSKYFRRPHLGPVLINVHGTILSVANRGRKGGRAFCARPPRICASSSPSSRA